MLRRDPIYIDRNWYPLWCKESGAHVCAVGAVGMVLMGLFLLALYCQLSIIKEEYSGVFLSAIGFVWTMVGIFGLHLIFGVVAYKYAPDVELEKSRRRRG